MRRPTRNETLKALDDMDGIVSMIGNDLWPSEVKSLAKVEAAARAYAEMAPDTCPCPGCDFGHHISAGGGGRKCSKCIGGYVWPDELVAKATAKLHGLGAWCGDCDFGSGCSHCDRIRREYAIGVLDVLWELE